MGVRVEPRLIATGRTAAPTANWREAQPTLQPLVDRADIVVTTEELATLYLLGRYDVRFSPSKLAEQEPAQQHEFGRDFRTGRAIIGSNDSMQLILSCFATGVLLGRGKPHLINAELKTSIEAQARPVDRLPPRSHLFAYAWERERPLRDGSNCAAAAEAVRRRPLPGSGP